MRFIVQMMRRMEWIWVGLVVDDSDEGLDTVRSLRSELQRSGVGCLAYVAVMDSTEAALHRTVASIKESTARVVIYTAFFLDWVLEEVGVHVLTVII